MLHFRRPSFKTFRGFYQGIIIIKVCYDAKTPKRDSKESWDDYPDENATTNDRCGAWVWGLIP